MANPRRHSWECQVVKKRGTGPPLTSKRMYLTILPYSWNIKDVIKGVGQYKADIVGLTYSRYIHPQWIQNKVEGQRPTKVTPWIRLSPSHWILCTHGGNRDGGRKIPIPWYFDTSRRDWEQREQPSHWSWLIMVVDLPRTWRKGRPNFLEINSSAHDARSFDLVLVLWQQPIFMHK